MGEIVTFYSFKGGVGRSMALANIAALLARWGYVTLVVDWDLEAPGLENFFKNYSNLENIDEQKGIVDLLYAAYDTGQGDAPRAADGPAPPHWKDYLVTVKLKDGNGTLHMLTAGRRDSEYFQRVRRFDVQEFYQEKRGGFFIEDLRREWRESYDFVLIDSRTGVTDIGGICTIQLPDLLVLLFTATDQGLSGAVEVAKKATAARQSLPFDRLKLLTVPIPSRFDDTEHELSKLWLLRTDEQVSNIFSDWLPRDVQRREMLELTKIPYRAYFSYGERLAVIDEGTVSPTGMGYAYETLAALVANKLGHAELLPKGRDNFVRQAAKSGDAAKPKAEAASPALLGILAGHKEWLDSLGAEGERADLSHRLFRAADFAKANLARAVFIGVDLGGADLSGADTSAADFSEANLQGANLESARGFGANFKKATLIDAQLTGARLDGAAFQSANLQGASLQNASLRRANFEEANLSGVNLKSARLWGVNLEDATVTGAVGLRPWQLGGANLAGAKLPGSVVADFTERVGAVHGISKYANTIFLTLLGLCAVFVYVITAQTTDERLLSGSSLYVPFFGFNFTLNAFYLAGPPVMTILYFFLHFNLQRLWDRLAELPAVFPDGRALDSKLSLWFVPLMTRFHFELLQERSLSTLQRWLFVFLAWWLMPLLLVLFWWRYLPLRDPRVTAVHAGLIVITVGAALYFYRLAVRTLRGQIAVTPTDVETRQNPLERGAL